jgi:phosphoesterase RecJ-like protein
MNSQGIEPVVHTIIEAIEENEAFLVVTHLKPDGDAVGSVVALGRVLRARGKSCHLLSPGEIPAGYRFLPAAGEIGESVPPREKWDGVFVLDTPCASRLPLSLSGTIPPCKELINIDHHPDNKIEGSLNWIDPDASSVGEMLYRLFKEAGYAVTRDVATPLYAAILTDTGCFRFPNTTPSALMAAAELMERGADAADVADRVYASHSLRKLRLLGEALGTLQTACSGRVAFMWVTAGMLEKVGASLLDADGFVNFPREVAGAEVGMLFKEEKDGRKVEVSLRSKSNLVDVSRVAAQFQGGGHHKAAGCVVEGSMPSVQERVVEAVAAELARADAARTPERRK